MRVAGGNRPCYWYKVVRMLGQGGSADVYQCAVVSNGGSLLIAQQYAVKVLRERGDPENRDRFQREAVVLRRLRHPNLVPALEVNLDHDPPYYVMPIMKETLAEHLYQMRLRRQVYRAKHALESFLLPLSSAVEFLHLQGIVHRDIKPWNIYLDSNGTPKLGDLSICHLSRLWLLNLTWCGMGTPNYTAPETLSMGIASRQSDIYSLGVVLYEMITGQIPRPCWWQWAANLPSVQHPRSCHRYVDTLLIGMTNPEPALRYADLSHVMTDMRTLLREYLPRMPVYALPPLSGLNFQRQPWGGSPLLQALLGVNPNL